MYSDITCRSNHYATFFHQELGGNLTINSKSKRANSGLKFKEASVTGNPVAYAMGQAKYLCNSKIKPYMPYYLSTLDEKMWRSGLSDMLYLSTWVPGMNEVSSNKNQTDEFLKSAFTVCG
jgi:hypothetical protein